MKKLIVLLLPLVLFFTTSYTQGTWELKDSPIVDNLVSVCFTDADHGWILSDEGNILITEDGGVNWMMNFVDGIPESIHFSDANHGCIVGYNESEVDSSFILMTTDGGLNWSSSPHLNEKRLFDIFFINNNIGWTVGWNDPTGWILYTDDGGLNWTRQMTELGVSGELYGVHFRDETHGNICGVFGTFLHTTNGGTIGNGWAINISIPSLGKDLYSVYNFGDLFGCAVGADGTVIYTIDHWTNWIEMNSGITNDLKSVMNVEGTQHIWAVGNNGIIIHNQMYIMPWDVQVSNTTENLNDVCMINENEGWAVGDNGTILYYSTSTSLVNNTNDFNFEIYPNPADNFIHICFGEKITFKQIQLTSITGKLLQSMDVEKQDEIFINVANLPRGVYLIHALGIDTFGVQKIILK